MELTKQAFQLEQVFSEFPWETVALRDLLEGRKNSSVLQVPKNAGVYVFWWTGSEECLSNLHTRLLIKGKVTAPGEHHRHEIYFSTEWMPEMNLEGKTRRALYVGKSTNIKKRLGLHLRTKTTHLEWRQSLLTGVNCLSGRRPEIQESNYSNAQHYSLFAPTTTCQFRAGMELLGLGITDEVAFWELLKDNITFSFLSLDDQNKDRFVPFRFYLEDYLIGALRPWFNLDSER